MTTRTSQDRSRPSSRLDSEGEEEDDDADKVISPCWTLLISSSKHDLLFFLIPYIFLISVLRIWHKINIASIMGGKWPLKMLRSCKILVKFHGLAVSFLSSSEHLAVSNFLRSCFGSLNLGLAIQRPQKVLVSWRKRWSRHLAKARIYHSPPLL